MREVISCPVDMAKNAARACGLDPAMFAGGAGAGLALALPGNDDGQGASVLCALPVAGGDKTGVQLFAGCTCPQARRQGLMTALLERACAGAAFAVASLAFGGEDFLARRGFTVPLYRRRASLAIRPDIYATAGVDTVTAAGWAALRRQALGPEAYLPKPALYPALHRAVYAGGATFMEKDGAWIVFFEDRPGNRILVPELYAPTDREGSTLLAAARNRTGLFNALVLLPAQSELLLGEGVKEKYAVLRPGPGYCGEEPRLMPWL